MPKPTPKIPDSTAISNHVELGQFQNGPCLATLRHVNPIADAMNARRAFPNQYRASPRQSADQRAPKYPCHVVGRDNR